MGFPLIPTSVTLNDLERRYGPLWPFFSCFSLKTVGFGTYHAKLSEVEPTQHPIFMTVYWINRDDYQFPHIWRYFCCQYKHIIYSIMVCSCNEYMQCMSQSFFALWCIMRLHRIHEMLTILTDVRGVCLSVSLSVTRLISALLCKNGWTDQDAVWGKHSRGPMEHCVRRGFWSPTERGRGPTSKFWKPPPMSGTAEARDLKFCVHIKGLGPNENYAKLGHRGIGAVSCDLILNFGTPLYLQND